MTILRFDSLESTNKYCEALDLAQVEDFTCYWALAQTAGIGQRGEKSSGLIQRGTECFEHHNGHLYNRWHAAPGQDLTFSLVLHPTFLPADRQFKLTQAVSLGILDCIATLVPKETIATIKWPNDIYAGGKKICGTLISTRLSTLHTPQPTLHSAVCGIGLNVNGCDFPDWVPHPTSLSLLTGRRFELEPLLRQLLQCVGNRYSVLRDGLDPEPEYLRHLLNLGVPARYLYNGETVEATITGVDPHGRLQLDAADGRHLSCGMKEISFVF